jgi:hypothetical protein
MHPAAILFSPDGLVTMRPSPFQTLAGLLTAALLLLPWNAAQAQVLLLPSDIGGEISDDQASEMRQAFEEAIRRHVQADIISEEQTAAELGPLAACDNVVCAAEIGAGHPAQALVHLTVFGAGDIYDMRIAIFHPTAGELLAEEVTDCTFCPFQEAVDAVALATRAVASRLELPPLPQAPTTDVVATDDTQTPGLESPAGPAWAEGETRIRIAAEPRTARILVNGQEVGRGQAEIEAGAGTIVVTVDAPDHAAFETTLRLDEQAPDRDIFASLARLDAGRRAPAPTGTDSGAGFNQQAVGAITMGVGAAMLVGGLVALALDGRSACGEGPIEACESIYETTAPGAVLTTLGALGVGTGAALFVRGTRADRAATAQHHRIGISPTARGASVRWQLRF